MSKEPLSKDAQEAMAVTLRGVAQARLSSARALEPQWDWRRALHELQVHEIELRIQNEELRRAQAELESARLRYQDLFENAPIAYLTLDAACQIRSANRAAASLLGAGREALCMQAMGNFVHLADRECFGRCTQQVLASGDPASCELRLQERAGAAFAVQMEVNAVLLDHEERALRLMLVAQSG